MLTGRYETSLVVVSVLVAIFASYTTLSLAGRITKMQGTVARWWIAGGAIAMGSGIWAMHFIGMLAFRLPIPVGYDLWITLLSLLSPIVVSGLALWQVSQPELPLKRLLSSAFLMGLGINTMHYTGMAAMRMQPGIQYDPLLFAASVLIAITASAAALWIAFKLRRNVPHLWAYRMVASMVMGTAIVGMHYTGMAAAHFPAGSICLAADSGFSQNGLAILVIIATAAILSVALITSVFDARLESRAEVLAISEATAEERRVLLLREQAARADAERMSAMKDEFLATLSHELRTPLNSILGWAQILRRGVTDETTLKKGLDTIERNARAQAELIEDLLDMSRIISGKVRLDIQPVDPIIFIEAALETVRPAALAKNIQLDKSLDPGVGVISGDLNRLQQVMWNLLSNAVKFTPSGGRVTVTLTEAQSNIEIKVSDSGIGISPEFLPYVFDRFRQADASTTRKYSGLGLGLSIVKHLVELHGGSIHVHSPGEGRGTVFTVCLPLATFQFKPGPETEQRAAASSKEAQRYTHVDLSGVKVLLVDDEADSLGMIEQVLLSTHAKILTASNAWQAYASVQKEQPDIVISDIGMPDMDGYELIREIRRLGETQGKHIPAIALTAFTRTEDRQRALQAGFDKFLPKPVDPAALLSSLAEMVKHPSTMD